MISQEKNQEIAKIVSCGEFIRSELAIPNYQRPYTWKKKQLYQLLDDLKDSFETKQSTYLLGTLIVYIAPGKSTIELVDGQQRITTISLILWLLGFSESGLRYQKYNHSESNSNLIQNFQTVKDWLERKEIDKESFKEFILTKVLFVQITAPTLDEAFVFFDSQNSRGKSLEKYDLLKAHHLRYIKGRNEQVAYDCTVFWEKIDKSNKLGFLIYSLLGRTRIWSRKEYHTVDVLHEFKSQRVTNNSDGFYQLNYYQQPPVFEKWRYIDREEYDDDDGLELIFKDIDIWLGSKRIKFVSESKKYLPFQIMQPLEGGEQFFWFVQKYNQLHDDLFVSQCESLPRLFIELSNRLKSYSYNLGISYLLEVYESACLFYYDKFGIEGLLEFAISLEHHLSILRFRQSTIQYASIAKFIKEEHNNVFSIINEAAFPEHIIRKIIEKTEGKYRRFSKSDFEKGIRKDFFDGLYGLRGFYTVNKTQLSGMLVLNSKKKFQEQIQN